MDKDAVIEFNNRLFVSHHKLLLELLVNSFTGDLIKNNGVHMIFIIFIVFHWYY